MAEQVTVQDLIRREAKTAGVPESLALAVADQESGFNPTVTGPKLPSGAQAIGTFQLLPETAKMLGVDPNDPAQNIRGGVTYLRQLLDRHNGDLTKVLSEYGGVKTDTQYVPSVLARIPRFQRAAAPTSAAAAVSPAVGTPPPTAPAEETWTQWAARHGRQTLEAFDPRTPSGRRNLAGAAGAALGTAAVVGTAPVSLPVAGLTAAAAGILGAAGGGMLAESGEQLVGTAPPSGEAALGAGAQQAAYETVGQGLMRGVINPIGRRLIGTRVARFAGERIGAAREALSQSKQAILDRLQTGLQAAQDLVHTTSAAGRQQVAQAREVAQAGVQAARTQAERGAASVVGQSPDAALAGRQVVRQVYGETGGAKVARDVAGQAIEQAAESGPPVNLTPIKAQARAMVEQATPPAVTEEAGTGYLQNAIGSRGATSPAERSGYLEALKRAGVVLEPSHPLPGVLSKLEAAPDEVSFLEAHKLKRALDEAVNWESPAKKQIVQITKGVRQVLRDTMAGHAPYDQATAHYAKIAPLYTKGIAARLRKLAVEEPEAIVRLIDPNKPTQAEMLTHLLTTQAAEGGQAAEGQAALRSVQAAWIHQKVIQGDVTKLGDRIAALPSEFRNAFLGDQHAQEILSNLQLISDGLQAGIKAERGRIPAAREAAAQATEAAKMGVPRARQALTAGRAQLAEQTRALKGEASALARSTLLPRGTLGADVLRAAVLAPRGEFWGFVSLVKLLHGPTARDLLTWASASPRGTRMLVSALTSSQPALALADLTRGILSEIGQPPPLAVSHEPTSSVGQPPPATERTALPTPQPTEISATIGGRSSEAPAPAPAAGWLTKALPSGQIQVTSPAGTIYYAPDQATADQAIAAATAREKGR